MVSSMRATQDVWNLLEGLKDLAGLLKESPRFWEEAVSGLRVELEMEGSVEWNQREPHYLHSTIT